jgi:serine/threonine protein kinase
VLHRDIKPENLILDVSGYIKLTDFGVSKYFLGATPSAEGDEGDGEGTPEPMVCKSTSGTHGYMPPEIYFKGHLHGKPADYFAVGVTLHELLLGQVRVCMCVCECECVSLSVSLSLTSLFRFPPLRGPSMRPASSSKLPLSTSNSWLLKVPQRSKHFTKQKYVLRVVAVALSSWAL